ncbi:MAG: PhoH family protein, partial [Arenimonas sp.]
MTQTFHTDFTLTPDDPERLANLCGPFDENLREIELRMGVEIANRGNVFRINGEEKAAKATERFIKKCFVETLEETIDLQGLNIRLGTTEYQRFSAPEYSPQEVTIRVKRGVVKGRGGNQAKYLHAIATHDINFGIGPAGTGKTYLAVASAVEALNESRVQRILLVRPAVEAGEKLGFLPGDLTQKVDPYLR